MPHQTTITVRFTDLDPYNHVNHARYLSYFESARIEALDEMGFGMADLANNDLRIVLTEVSMRFLRPASLHDQLTITTWVKEVGRASSRWQQQAHCADLAVVELELKAAFTDHQGRPHRAPTGFAEAAQRFQ